MIRNVDALAAARAVWLWIHKDAYIGADGETIFRALKNVSLEERDQRIEDLARVIAKALRSTAQ